jgi:hypothetical protein
MQTVADGAKQGSVRTGVQIIRSEGVRGLYHGVSIYPLVTSRTFMSINAANMIAVRWVDEIM